MKITLLLIGFTIFSIPLFSQNGNIPMDYEPSVEHPYGRLNPNAPVEVAEFAKMIGTCDCKSLRRNPDRTWQDTSNMVWRFKYLMNGTAVQDEVWREGELYAGSIRQYQPDSAKWVVTYFSYPAVSTTPGVWFGNRVDGDIVLEKPQKAPNGMEGISRLTFHEISEQGFKWKGEWVDLAKTFVYPFLTIECLKQEE